MSTRADDWNESVSRLRDVLARIAVKCRDSGDLVEQALRILDNSERAWRRVPGRADIATKRTRGDAVMEYRVEPGPGGMSLVEVRSTGGQPFRCPEKVYRATVEALAARPEGSSFEELRAAAIRSLRAKGITQEPIYLFRVVLRFLKTKGLIQHGGRRFRPQGPATKFAAAARRAWRETAAAPLPV